MYSPDCSVSRVVIDLVRISLDLVDDVHLIGVTDKHLGWGEG